MNYYKEIKNKILDNEAYERVKDYSKERHKVLTYFEIGRLLHEAGKHYGEGVIKNYSERLSKELGNKYNERTLRRMRQFYVVFSNSKWSPKRMTFNNMQNSLPIHIRPSLATKLNNKNAANKAVFYSIQENRINSATVLTWSHYIELLKIKNIYEMQYYIHICIQQSLTRNELRNKIKSQEYQRLSIKTRNKLINKENLNIKDYVPNPILIKNSSNKDIISEKILHNLIMEDIASFMKELGEGYSFIDSEFKIKICDRYNYIDLLLYNYLFRCFVVIELKVTEFKSEYIGQILKYMNYIDSNIKTIEDNNTIGIIICKRNNGFYLEYCSDERLITREYKVI